LGAPKNQENYQKRKSMKKKRDFYKAKNSFKANNFIQGFGKFRLNIMAGRSADKDQRELRGNFQWEL